MEVHTFHSSVKLLVSRWMVDFASIKRFQWYRRGRHEVGGL